MDSWGFLPQKHHRGLGTGLHEVVQGCLQVVIPRREGQDDPDDPGIIGYLGHVQVA